MLRLNDKITAGSKKFPAIAILTIIAMFFTCNVSENDAAEKDYWADVGVTRMSGKKAPNFILNALDGSMVTLKDFRGKVVFLNFWASWCPPCRVEMPAIETLHEKFKDKGLVVIAINSAESNKRVRDFIRKKGYTFLVLMDSDGSVTNDYRVRGLPATYIVDRKGNAIGRAVGDREWDSRESFKLMEEILKK